MAVSITDVKAKENPLLVQKIVKAVKVLILTIHQDFCWARSVYLLCVSKRVKLLKNKDEFNMQMRKLHYVLVEF